MTLLSGASFAKAIGSRVATHKYGLGVATLWYRPDAEVDAVMPSAAPADGGGMAGRLL